jgi:hypothetical protein
MSKDKQRDKISTAKVLALLAVILVGMTLATDWLITSSEDQEFGERYKGVELGMSESTAVSLLGTPNDHSSEFYLGQKEGFEEAYERAAESGATHYLMWRKGIDMIYAVGINENGNVVVVEAGGT